MNELDYATVQTYLASLVPPREKVLQEMEDHAEKHVRLNFGTSRKLLEQGLERMRKSLMSR